MFGAFRNEHVATPIPIAKEQSSCVGEGHPLQPSTRICKNTNGAVKEKGNKTYSF